jgi:phosphonopyruvate decarboxylase
MAKVSTEKLSPKKLYQALMQNKVEYFCGVPDSSLSAFGYYLEDNSRESHNIAVNEGNAIALATGYYLATAKVPLVYMQNSGLGNAINPITSLVDPSVMGIPMILLVGWRGQPGTQDEPQHVKQGLVTTDLLDSLGLPFVVLSADDKEMSKQVQLAVESAIKLKQPFVLLVENDTFTKTKATAKKISNYELSREDAIKIIVDNLTDVDIIVATTGKASRELFEYRDEKQQSHKQDLLIVGGMGHASSIAYGIAKQKQSRRVFVIDGDGAVLMHMGSLALSGSKGLKNFYHFVINNGSHESVGGQATVAHDIDLTGVAKDCGYVYVRSLADRRAIIEVIKDIKKMDGPVFVEIKVRSSSRQDLSRPSIHPTENKESFMAFLDEL